MEEKPKKDIQKIVNKLRHPAVITDRNSSIINSQAYPSSFPANFGPYELHQPAKSSLLSIIDHCNKDDMLIYENYNFDEIKDSCTQTSKTILELAKLEAAEMSPDSLSNSPIRRSPNDQNVKDTFSNFTLNDTEKMSEHASNIPSNYKAPTIIKTHEYMISGNVIEPLNLEHEDCHKHMYENKSNRTIIWEQGNDMIVQHKCHNQSLIETFLNRSRKKEELKEKMERGEITEQKEQIGQPLTNNFKSQSCVNTYHPFNVPYEEENFHPRHTRFTLRNTPNNSKANSPTYYLPKKTNSFMMPTMASEKKNISGEVHKIKNLISPTRRGRSTSPRATPITSNKVDVYEAEEKIPYIDQSNPNISKNVQQSSILERSVSPKKLLPVLPANNFNRDIQRIDQMSLTLPMSDDNLSIHSKGTDCSTLSSENNLAAVLARVQDRDWSVSLRGLAEVTELCKMLDLETVFPHMITVNQKLIELLRSPRSHVCRTACQAAGHLFESMKDTRGPEFNDIVDLLLSKTADSNKFIRQDANLTLDCMVTHIATFHSIRALCARGPVHKNNLVRSATARLIICAVVIAGPQVILNPNSNESTRKRICINMIKFLEDKNCDTRKYGERLYKVLSKEPFFEHFLKKYMDRDHLTKLKKTLKFLSRK